MRLLPGGREYVYLPVSGVPEGGTLVVSFDGGTNWTDATLVSTMGDGSAPPTGFDQFARILVAGPDATDNPASTVVLVAGRNYPQARLTDAPEVVIRASTGVVEVA